MRTKTAISVRGWQPVQRPLRGVGVPETVKPLSDRMADVMSAMKIYDGLNPAKQADFLGLVLANH